MLERHAESLLALAGVVGAGIGERAGQPCIRVFVVAKTADLSRLIPATIEGYAVEIEETGAIVARETP